MTAVRLRQVALVAAELEPAAEALRKALSLDEPFRDPGVGEFGLQNVVFSAGDTFIEIVSPVRENTTAGRYLDRRGGDSGYMALFQVPDTAAARARAADQGVRVVWQVDLPDISGTHLHPKDVPGAIVSVDTPKPPETWRWGGPSWTGQVPPHHDGGIVGMTVECDDPARTAATWGALLGISPAGHELTLDGGRQTVTFRRSGARGEGISELVVAIPGGGDELELCGLTLRVVDGDQRGGD
ncbi:MAG TPA: VOC family protein [Acidimicrobiales bacterium]|nr:VOC family protein [Acidimicrobiales bacterium]